MPLTGKERNRRYRERIKSNPEKYNAYKMKEKLRYQRKKDAGTVKQIKDMTEREKRKTRRGWRAAQQKRRLQKVLEKNKENVFPSPLKSDGRKESGRKRRKKKSANLYRRISSLESQLDKKAKLADKYRCSICFFFHTDKQFTIYFV